MHPEAEVDVSTLGAFSVGDHVVYQAHGIGRIEGTESRGSAGPCCVVHFASGLRLFIPIDRVHDSLRALSSREEASAMLEQLRTRGIARDGRSYKERAEERTRLLRSGTRLEIAGLLRRMYAGKAPASDSDAQAIRTMEELLLPEIALVLGLTRAALETEMRELHPVFARGRRA